MDILLLSWFSMNSMITQNPVYSHFPYSFNDSQLGVSKIRTMLNNRLKSKVYTQVLWIYFPLFFIPHNRQIFSQSKLFLQSQWAFTTYACKCRIDSSLIFSMYTAFAGSEFFIFSLITTEKTVIYRANISSYSSLSNTGREYERKN